MALIFVACCLAGGKSYADDSLYGGIIDKYINRGIIQPLAIEGYDRYFTAKTSGAAGPERAVHDFFDEMRGFLETSEAYSVKGYDVFSYTSSGQAKNVWGYVATIYSYAGWRGIRVMSLVERADGKYGLGDSRVFASGSQKYMFYFGMATASDPYETSDVLSPFLKDLERSRR
jgi:hypothetical protein